MEKSLGISVILPIFSEEEVLYGVLESLDKNIGGHMLEVIGIVSPKSAGKTFEICAELSKKYGYFSYEKQEVNPGLGNAVRQGMKKARGNYVLLMDSDGEMEAGSAKLMAEKIVQNPGLDLVVASRWKNGGSFEGYGLVKYWLNFAYQRVCRLIFSQKISDFTLGYKIMRAEFAHGIKWEGAMHEIAHETTLAPIICGAAVDEVPTKWAARASGSSKNSIGNNFGYLAVFFRMAWLKLTGAKRCMG